MATNSDHLLLKGVCLHVANMFTQRSAGRDCLKEHNWEVNLLKKNEYSDSEFICLPSNVKSFLSIPKKNKVEPFQLKSFYWDKYYKLLSHIQQKIKDNQKATEFFEVMTRIPNRFTTTKPVNITEFLQNKTDMQIYKNTKLFYLILMMLTYYNFPIGVRKSYYMIMDHFLNVPNFLVLLDEDTDFEEFLKI